MLGVIQNFFIAIIYDKEVADMTEETYEIAKDLIEDINRIETQINEVKNNYGWITISTYDHPNIAYSLRFQNDLIEWLTVKKEEYQKEFEEL